MLVSIRTRVGHEECTVGPYGKGVPRLFPSRPYSGQVFQRYRLCTCRYREQQYENDSRQAEQLHDFSFHEEDGCCRLMAATEAMSLGRGGVNGARLRLWNPSEFVPLATGTPKRSAAQLGARATAAAELLPFHGT
jgi:hypothetical protein